MPKAAADLGAVHRRRAMFNATWCIAQVWAMTDRGELDAAA